jgi:hypothetical protein
MLENWSSRDVQRDPAGFLKAQAAERERQEGQAKKQQETDDLERFTRAFVAEGGEFPMNLSSGEQHLRCPPLVSPFLLRCLL